MTPTTPVQDLATQWKFARRLYPIYFELAREFALDVKPCADLEVGAETPGKEAVQQANQWLDEMDLLIQVHQLRQFLQTSSLVTPEGLESLLQHFLAKTPRTDIIRDKIDFLLVQYFSQLAPTGVGDPDVDLAYVAQALEPVLGEVELKPPVWLNSLDRVLDAARKCRSLDELLHGGVLEQGRKAKSLAGDLFYLPVALVAFTRFGYLMRRTFFRLMLGDLNTILDGLTELEEKGVETIDCRRAQFSEKEPIVRLRVICQSWKVMFQAEYSSGSPLRMLVDLRASVEHALGRGKAPEAPVKTEAKAEAKPKAEVKAPAAKAVPAAKPPLAKPAASTPSAKPAVAGKAAPLAAKPLASAAAAGASKGATKASVTPVVGKASAAAAHAKPEPAESDDEPGFAKAGFAQAEFEVSATPGWDEDSASQPGKKK
jgi:hypothetical protein